MTQFLCQNQSSRQPRLGPDAGESHLGKTAGESRMFQGVGAPSRTSLVPPYQDYPLHHDSRAPPPEQLGRALSRSPPFAAPRASTHQAPRPPPAFEAPPQPSTSGWVPPGPLLPRSRHDSSGSYSEASESESVTSARDSASARLADLIYEVCPDSRPLFDPKAPRCGFEAWFGQPEAVASKQRFRMYPRVAEVQEEVAARSESLARRSKLLSRVIPTHARAYALADDAVFASSQPVTSAFAQLASSKVFGSRRWGTTPGSSSGLFDSELLSEVVSQVHNSSQISSNLALLRRGRSAPASSSSPLSGPRLPSFPRGRPYGKRSSSSSRSGGRKRFRGGKGGAPSSGPSGFRRWEPSPFRTLSSGCLSLHWQAWRDRGAEPWVVEVLRVGYCLPFLSAPPLSNVPIPMPSYSPTSIMGAVLEEVTLGFIATGAVELAPLPSPGFYSRGHRPLPSPSLCGRVSLPHGDHSVCAPVGASGGLDGLHPSEGSVSSSAGSSSFSSLSSLHVQGHCLPFQRAVLWPLHGSAGLHQGHDSCFSYTPFSGVPYEPVSRRLASPVCLSGVPPQGSSDCPPTLSRVGVCGQTLRNPTWFHHRWFSIWGLSSTPPLSGLLRRRSASLGCGQQPQSFSPAPRLPRAYGSRYSAYFLRWLT